MTDLRLASIDGVATIGVGGLSDIAASARGFADALDGGEITARTAILLSVSVEGCLEIAWFGQELTVAEALGLFELAKVKTASGAWK